MNSNFLCCRSTWTTHSQVTALLLNSKPDRHTHTPHTTPHRLALCLCWHEADRPNASQTHGPVPHTQPENSMWRSQKDSRYTNAQTTVTHSLQQITQDSGQTPERIPPEDRRSSCERLRASRSCINQLWCLTQLTEDNRVIIQLNVDSIH